MGGICGFIGLGRQFNNEYMLNVVKTMNSALYENNQGYIFADSNCVICGNETYVQNESHIIFFHGDLYNKKELAHKYGAEDCNEAETCLAGWQKDGNRLLERLSGKFLLIIYDKVNKKLIAARDKVGSKQMYYYKNDECFLFCTELGGLLSTDIVPKKVDKRGLSQYLQLTYIPAPISIIDSVKKVNAAVKFSLDKDGHIDEKEYWNITNKASKNAVDFKKCKDELKELLYESVKNKMELYEDSGAFLSGGFDSSIVVGIMADLSERPIKTFTIGYGDKQYDESSLAGIVAKKNGTDHTVLKLDWNNVSENIDTILEGLDEPYADSSLIATYAVCRLAKKCTSVAFMGDAGDELFAGYNKYLISYYGNKYKKIPCFLRKRVIEPLVKLIPATSTLRRKISKVIASAELSILEQRKLLMSLGFKPEELKKLMIDGFVDDMNFIDRHYEFLSCADEQTKAQYIDFKTVLEGDMLPKVELAGRFSGLKTCAPILDDKIVKFAYSIPTEFKINKTNRKIILKETFRYLLPDELFSAPKHGFAVPIGAWLENELKDRLLEFSSKDFLEKQGLFDYGYINEIMEEHFTHRKNRYSELWAFFVFQNWYKKYIEG